MKEKIINTQNALIASFIVAGIFIGLMVVAQFRSHTVVNSFILDEFKAQQELLDSFDAERRSLNIKIADLRSKIEEKRKSIFQNDQIALLSVLEDLKKEIGMSKVRGDGIEIKMSDGLLAAKDEDSSLVHSADLRDMVNLLQTAKAEAISINQQRITGGTAISSVGNSILINRSQVSAPFKIEVIGDIELIAQRIKDRNSYPDLFDRIKDKKIGFEISAVKTLLIPALEGEYTIKYAGSK